ncbi:MAG: M48 family metalloprotease, partial [Burkholderiaceae bacterium]|nr:M48 family metalloprotease [Burkholderiaceae bacterium]
MRRRLLACLLSGSIGCGALWSAAQAQVNLPALGDTASEDFNLGTERHLGDAIMRDIRRDPDYLDDPILLEYLQSLWQPLVASARLRGDIGEDLSQRFPYEPFLVRDRSVNAFALPGGYVGVHLGLMAITSNRDELASVLAHEMTHINQRHIARGFANSKRQSLISAAAMIIGVLAATRSGGGDAASAMITGGQAVGIQGQLNFSRDMEREADRIGAAMMTDAGFQPSGMASMFERLQQSSRLNDSGGYPYLRSHPLTTERIGEARARLGTAGVGSTGALVSSPATALEHSAAQARARVLMDTRVDALRRWQALDNEGSAANATLGERFANAYST